MIPDYASLFFIFLNKFMHNNFEHFLVVIVQNAVKGSFIPPLHLFQQFSSYIIGYYSISFLILRPHRRRQ